MSDPRVDARDAGLGRLGRLTAWIAAGAVAVTGALMAAVAVAQQATSSGSPVSAPVGSGGIRIEDPRTGPAVQPGIQAPVQPPQAVGGGSGIVSGGS